VNGSTFHKKVALYLLNLTWFVPFFHARTTAENLGMSLFIFGLYPLIKNTKSVSLESIKTDHLNSWHYVLLGILFGVSFILRFQMALMTAGLFIWIFVMQRQIRWKTIPLMLGVILAIVANGYLDYWGYGTWTFSAWNYFYANLVQGVASGFGVSPWYYYITKTFAKGIPPLSLFYIISLFYLWVRHPKSLLTWSSFSFCFIHSYLGHKEIRFLFGMFFFIPFCYLIWAPFLTGKIKKFFIALVPVMFVLNTGALFISSIKPAFGPINMYRFLYHESPTVTKIYTLGVFRDQLRFYLKKPIEQVVIKDNVKRDMETLVNERPETVQWYLTDKYQDYLTIKDSKICTIKYASYPTWLLDMSLAKKALKRSKTWSLFRCELLSESGN
jgi:phosphatidylinositol glycan class B